MKSILITGGTGLIGQKLSKKLVEKGHQVSHLSRTVSGTEKYPTYKWDLHDNYVDKKAFDNLEIIIHLAGENVSAGRWTTQQKNRILSSRVDSLNLILNNFPKNQQLEALISASGISIYGTQTTDHIFKEDDDYAHDFLANVSVEWEKAAESFNSIAQRVAMIRTGIVLSKNGGALKRMITPTKFGIGSPLGSGKQYMPWIHIEDIVGIYLKAVEDTTIKGAYNGVSSEHCTNKAFTKAIAKTLNKPFWAPNVPSFVLKLLFGEMSEIILKGSRIDNEKIKQAGYQFHHEKLEKALENLLK